MSEERRLAAIMFCDVCNFSRITGEDENRALAIVEMTISCIESGSAVYGGRIIKKLGDGAPCEFPPSEWREVEGVWYLRLGRAKALSVMGEKSDTQRQRLRMQQ